MRFLVGQSTFVYQRFLCSNQGRNRITIKIVHNSQSIRLPTSFDRSSAIFVRAINKLKQHNAQISFYIVTVPGGVAMVVVSGQPGRSAPVKAYMCDVGCLMVGVGLLILGGGAGAWRSPWSQGFAPDRPFPCERCLGSIVWIS